MAFIDRAERENKIVEQIKTLVGAKEKYKLRKFNDPERDKKKNPRAFLRGGDSDSESSGDADWSPERDAASLLRALADLRKHQEHMPPLKPTAPGPAELAALKSWLGASFASNWETVDVVTGLAEGSGLVARRALAAGEPFLFVSRESMMTYEDVLRAPLLGPLCRSDKLLTQMPELALVLLLMQEAADPSSRWRAYIDALPAKFDTPLFYSRHDFAELAGSPALEATVSFLRQSVRVYTYLRPIASQFSIAAGRFSWANFAWASSVVTSRQNSIPFLPPGAAPDAPPANQLALIPVWDMCNHEPIGEITSFFDVARGGVHAQAVRAFAAGEPITMNYGPRANVKLLTFAGFAVRNNPYDSYAIKLAVPEPDEDPLAPVRNGMLGKQNIASECTFHLNAAELDPNALMFARVLAIARDEIKTYAGIFEGKRVSLKCDDAAFDLLTATCQDALAGIQSSADADEALVADPATSSLKRSMVLLRIGERALLTRNIELIAAARAEMHAAADAKRAKKLAKKAGSAAGATGAASAGAQ